MLAAQRSLNTRAGAADETAALIENKRERGGVMAEWCRVMRLRDEAEARAADETAACPPPAPITSAE